jgi:hypothetical protein
VKHAHLSFSRRKEGTVNVSAAAKEELTNFELDEFIFGSKRTPLRVL